MQPQTPDSSPEGIEVEVCTFCRIVSGHEPATIFSEDENFIVFRNQLRWVPSMILVVPKAHITQQELWTSGQMLSEVGALAVVTGETHCPDGFRIVSNFGRDALQSQPHAHLHVLGGAELGPYVVPRQWMTPR